MDSAGSNTANLTFIGVIIHFVDKSCFGKQRRLVLEWEMWGGIKHFIYNIVSWFVDEHCLLTNASGDFYLGAFGGRR